MLHYTSMFATHVLLALVVLQTLRHIPSIVCVCWYSCWSLLHASPHSHVCCPHWHRVWYEEVGHPPSFSFTFSNRTRWGGFVLHDAVTHIVEPALQKLCCICLLRSFLACFIAHASMVAAHTLFFFAHAVKHTLLHILFAFVDILAACMVDILLAHIILRKLVCLLSCCTYHHTAMNPTHIATRFCWSCLFHTMPNTCSCALLCLRSFLPA